MGNAVSQTGIRAALPHFPLNSTRPCTCSFPRNPPIPSPVALCSTSTEIQQIPAQSGEVQRAGEGRPPNPNPSGTILSSPSAGPYKDLLPRPQPLFCGVPPPPRWV